MNARRDHAEEADTLALERMLDIRPGGNLTDGRAIVIEAMTSGDADQRADFEKRLATAARDAVRSGDYCELGRIVHQQIVAYARRCPAYENTYGAELGDLSFRDHEEERRDEEFERESQT